MIAIGNGRGNPRTMTTSAARNVLVQFKKHFPDWHRTSLQNSIIEITPEGVEIWHADRGRLVHDGSLLFDDGDWLPRFEELLRLNAARNSSLPGA